jgi:hypothetical protein
MAFVPVYLDNPIQFALRGHEPQSIDYTSSLHERDRKKALAFYFSPSPADPQRKKFEAYLFARGENFALIRLLVNQVDVYKL